MEFFNVYTFGIILTILLVIFFECKAAIANNSSNSQASYNRTDKKMFAVFFILFWGFLAAFRDLSVGTDTFHYAQIFQRVATTKWSNVFRDPEFSKFPLYILYNKIISVITNNINAATFFNSFIIIIGVVFFLYYNSDNFGISLLCYLVLQYYFLSLNISRESLALMFTLWVYHYSIRNKFGKGLLFSIIAVLTHRTAILSFAVLFIAFISRTPKSATWILILGSFIILFFKPIIILAVNFFPQYSDYISTDNPFSLLSDTSNGRRIYTAMFLLVIFVVCLLYPKTEKNCANQVARKSKSFWVYFSLSFLALELMIFHCKNEVIARLEMYFTYFFIVSLPFFVEKISSSLFRRAIYIALIAVLLIPCYTNLKDYLPYLVNF